MKPSIQTLLCLIALALSASAGQALLVETTITEHHAKGGKDVLTTPRIAVVSGKQATVRVGTIEFAVTPTLLDDGTVDLRAVLAEHNGNNADKLAAPRVVSKLDQIAEIKVGSLAFTTKVSLAR